MAHKKGSGSTKNGRDSKSKRLGIKKYIPAACRKKGFIIPHLRDLVFIPSLGVRSFPLTREMNFDFHST